MPAGITDLKPCAKCGGPIVPICHRIRIDMGVMDQQNMQQFAGMYNYFGGKSASLAAIFAPGSNELVKFTTDVDPAAGTTLFLCNNCYCSGDLDIAVLVEQDNDKAKRRAEADGAD